MQGKWSTKIDEESFFNSSLKFENNEYPLRNFNSKACKITLGTNRNCLQGECIIVRCVSGPDNLFL